MEVVEECDSGRVALPYDEVGLFYHVNGEEVSSILKQFIQQISLFDASLIIRAERRIVKSRAKHGISCFSQISVQNSLLFINYLSSNATSITIHLILSFR